MPITYFPFCNSSTVSKENVEKVVKPPQNPTFCHNYSEPVFITKNGKGDLAVMSIEAYEELTSRFELYGLLKDGLDDVTTGNTKPLSEAMSEIRSRRSCLLYC